MPKYCTKASFGKFENQGRKDANFRRLDNPSSKIAKWENSIRLYSNFIEFFSKRRPNGTIPSTRFFMW